MPTSLGREGDTTAKRAAAVVTLRSWFSFFHTIGLWTSLDIFGRLLYFNRDTSHIFPSFLVCSIKIPFTWLIIGTRVCSVIVYYAIFDHIPMVHHGPILGNKFCPLTCQYFLRRSIPFTWVISVSPVEQFALAIEIQRPNADGCCIWGRQHLFLTTQCPQPCDHLLLSLETWTTYHKRCGLRHDSHDSAQGPGLETWRATLGDFPGGRLGRPTRIHFWAGFFHVFPCSGMPNT